MLSLFNLRYTQRLLRRSPSTAVIAVAIIALGLAVATPMYALVKSIAYGSLPFPDEKKIVRLLPMNIETGQPSSRAFDAYEVRLMEQTLDGFDEFASFDSYLAILSDGDVTSDFTAARVSPAFFSVLPATPLLGRTLRPEDNLANSEPVVLLGSNVWQNYYAADPNIVGQSSRINGDIYTIVGVMPEGYRYPEVHEVWTPARRGEIPEPGGNRNISVIGKLSLSAKLQTIDLALESFYSRVRTEFDDVYTARTAVAVPYTNYLAARSSSMPTWLLLMGIAFAVLGIVSFNLGNLLLIRANERTQELGIRNALGSTRLQLVAELLRESLLICLLGLVAGLMLSSLVLRFIDAEFRDLLATEVGLSAFPWWEFSLSGNTVLFAFVTTLAVWLSTGFFSAWKLLRKDISQVMQSGSRSVRAGGRNWTTQILVGLEITFSATLLVFCGAAFVAVYNGSHADFGVAPDSYITGSVSLPETSYPSLESRQVYLDSLRAEVSKESGVVDVAFATAFPGMFGRSVSYDLEDRSFDPDFLPSQNQVFVSPNYFDLLGISLAQGRDFDAGDTSGSLPVVIIGELFAANTWPDESPIGKRIQVFENQNSQWLEIVGVTPHLIHDEPMDEQSIHTTLYRPIHQSDYSNLAVAAMVDGDLASDFASYSNSLKLAAARVDREIPMRNIHTLDRQMQASMNVNGMLGDLLLGVAVVVFSLAIVALFAIVSRSIIIRASEIGIRRALGSTQLKAIWIFVKQGINYLTVAIPIGVGLGVLAAANFLENTNDVDDILVSVSLVVVLLIAVMVLAACYLPARKIASMEPGEALHYE